MKSHKKLFLSILIVFFALMGLGLTLAWTAVKLKITNDPGGVDDNDRYFTEIHNEHHLSSNKKATNAYNHQEKTRLLQQISSLYINFPADAERILHQFTTVNDMITVEKMLQAVALNTTTNFSASEKNTSRKTSESPDPNHLPSAFYWANLPEWPVLKEAISKDKAIIDSVSSLTGIDSRLISTVLIAEQIRLFDSRREAFKKWIQPLKLLTSETSFSWGVTGIKDFTARRTEENLLDSTSVFYPGKEFRHLLDFKTANRDTERFERITDAKNHYYAYLYAALYMKQIIMQWDRAGFPIENRPEIIATLYNIGFANSSPKATPQVGGATIDIGGRNYTFGRIAWEYFYSGELSSIFPFPATQ